MRHDNFIPPGKNLRIRSRGRLPHWELDDSIYSITIRLRDSLPRAVMASLIAERQAQLKKMYTPSERASVDRLFSIRLDSYLDRGYGSCILRDDKHAEIVANAFKYFDGSRYVLHAWCVMPNHAHVMIHVAVGKTIPRILHSWKSYTAHEIGHGSIWQEEYFDRIVRDEKDYADHRAYILRNPDKAGLVNWKWVGTGR